MKQDMIVILDLGSHENTVLARAIRALGVYSEIYPHDITVEELKALPNVKGIIINGGPNNVIDGAIRWVNTNNVNVAFTRAKEQIYVIGDDKKWRTLNDNFNFVLSNNRLPLNTEFYKQINL